jgi:peptide/nickel transport system ATP-binding protein
MILITHDLGVVAEMCDHCAVMYGGEIVEYGTVEQIFDNPKHPYTKALYRSIPSLDQDVERLHVIPGMVSDPSNLPSYCTFFDRCEEKCENCGKFDPGIVEVELGHIVKCFQFAGGWEEGSKLDLSKGKEKSSKPDLSKEKEKEEAKETTEAPVPDQKEVKAEVEGEGK